MRKLLWFTVGFTGAVAVGAYLLPPQLYFYVSGGCALVLALSLVLMFRFPKARIAAMVAFGCVLGFLWQSVFEANYLSVARSLDGNTVTLTLTAEDCSYVTDYGAATQCSVEIDGKRYKIWTYHDEEFLLEPGDTLTGQFLIRSTLPGGSSESDYNRSHGIFLTARAKGELSYAQAETLPWRLYPVRWRIQLTQRLQELFPADTAGFARALLLGDTDGIDYETDTAFKISGIRHIIAVSGLHISILFSLVYFFVGRRKWLVALLGLPMLLLFAAIAGFSPSITRACIMHALTVLALLLDREYDPPTALSFAVLTMLVTDPWTITHVGFQLSVGCVMGIFLFAEPMQNWLLDRKRLGRFKGRKGKLVKWLAISASISISANIITTPLSALYFGTVSLVSVLTNLLTLWIISYIFYGIMLSLAASALFYPLGVMVAWLVAWPIRFVLSVAKLLAAFPLAAVYTESIYIVFWLIFCYILLAVFLLCKQKHPLLLGSCAAICLCVALLASWLEPTVDDCRLTVLDVGQGQCILLQSDGKHYLIDCGGDSDEKTADKAAALLLSQGIHKLDGLILTHFDGDHADGAAYLLQRIAVDTLFLPNSLDSNDVTETLLQHAGSTVLRVDRQTEIQFDHTKITLVPSKNGESDNESGLCVLFQRQNCDILITGDLSAKGELELMETISLPQLEVLIVGHHGSKYSTSRELLYKTQPQYAIISVGADNFYGHPTPEVLDRLQVAGCIVLRTDKLGNIIYRG